MNKYVLSAFFLFCFFAFTGGGAFENKEHTSLPNKSSKNLSWEEVFEIAKKGVVHVKSHHANFDWERPDLPPQITHQSCATAFFIKAEEQIFLVTNNHVVDGALYIEISHPSCSEKFEASIEKVFPALDVALLTLPEKAIEKLCVHGECKPLILGNSFDIKSGEQVAVVGYPLGVAEPKITEGIISGCATTNGYSSQTILGLKQSILALQVSCAVNGGNSGGPCLTKRGEIIGIVSNGIEKMGDTIVAGTNFCVPIESIKDLWRKDISSKIFKPCLAGGYFYSAPKELLEHLGCFEITNALFTFNVKKDSLFDKMGLKTKDVIYAVNNCPFTEKGAIFHPYYKQNTNLLSYLYSLPHGHNCSLDIIRNGEKMRLSFVIDRVESTLGDKAFIDPFIEPEKIEYEIVGGAIVLPFRENLISLNPFRARSFFDEGEESIPQKLIVANILANSPADKAFLDKGEIILRVNEQAVETLKDFRQAVSLSQKTGKIVIETYQGLFVIKLSDIKNSEKKLAALHNCKTTSFMQEVLSMFNG